MTAETRRRAFEPFFTTRATSGGTGLGLATCYGVVTQAGGRIDIDSEVGRGTEFLIWLPARQTLPVTATALAGTINDQPPVSATILLVDDDGVLREVVARNLRAGGYRVLSATDADDARAVAARHEGAIDLMVTDLVMPRANGYELAAALRQTRPELAVLVMSGLPSNHVPHTGEFEFIAKPFGADQLLARVEEVLRSSRSAAARGSASHPSSSTTTSWH
jgi:CheY-like chemotaxis protein